MGRAVNIAILPSAQDCVGLVALNAKLLEAGDDEIRLALFPGPGKGLPHLSLSMGTLEQSDFIAAIDKVAAIAHDLKPIRLKSKGIETRGNAAGGSTTSLGFEPDAGLSEIHERIMATFADLLGRDPGRGDLIQPDDGDAERTLEFIRSFTANSAHANFDPHVTLGHGGPLDDAGPETVTFDRMGIYVLGPGCTCRKEILGVDLRR